MLFDSFFALMAYQMLRPVVADVLSIVCDIISYLLVSEILSTENCTLLSDRLSAYFSIGSTCFDWIHPAKRYFYCKHVEYSDNQN